MSKNYYDLQTKAFLASSLLTMVISALSKAAKLGKDGKELLDSLTVTLIEATSKRNVLAEELECEEEGSRKYLADSISMRREMERLKDEASTMQAQQDWDEAREKAQKEALRKGEIFTDMQRQLRVEAATCGNEQAKEALKVDNAKRRVLGMSEELPTPRPEVMDSMGKLHTADPFAAPKVDADQNDVW